MAQIYWTSFRFSAPASLPEDVFASARSYPSEFLRVFVQSHLRDGIKRYGARCLTCGAVAGALFGIAGMLNTSKQSGWSYTFCEVAASAGTCVLLSAILTFASFVTYAAQHRSYWTRVCAAAKVSESYFEFLIVARERCLLSNIVGSSGVRK